MNPNCVERSESIVAPQALHLNNNQLVRELAGAFAQRVWLAAPQNPDQQIDLAFQLATGRPPSATELEVSRESMNRIASAWSASESPDRKTLENLCHALMNSAAFLYID
jgi:hypothetical protein